MDYKSSFTFICLFSFVFYLKGSQAELDEDSGLCSCVFWQEGKHHVVHPKQRDEEQSGFGQPPAHIVKKRPVKTTYSTSQVICMCLSMCSCGGVFILSSLEVTGVVAADTRRSQLLDQNADHIDEDEEVHLHETNEELSKKKNCATTAAIFITLSNQTCSDKDCCAVHMNLPFQTGEKQGEIKEKVKKKS